MSHLYWSVEIIEPDDPEDNRCIMLRGDLGEVVGPMTIELAQKWIDYFDDSRLLDPCGKRRDEA
jgi:hypothetical protein